MIQFRYYVSSQKKGSRSPILAFDIHDTAITVYTLPYSEEYFNKRHELDAEKRLDLDATQSFFECSKKYRIDNRKEVMTKEDPAKHLPYHDRPMVEKRVTHTHILMNTTPEEVSYFLNTMYTCEPTKKNLKEGRIFLTTKTKNDIIEKYKTYYEQNKKEPYISSNNPDYLKSGTSDMMQHICKTQPNYCEDKKSSYQSPAKTEKTKKVKKTTSKKSSQTSSSSILSSITPADTVVVHDAKPIEIEIPEVKPIVFVPTANLTTLNSTTLNATRLNSTAFNSTAQSASIASENNMLFGSGITAAFGLMALGLFYYARKSRNHNQGAMRNHSTQDDSNQPKKPRGK